MSDTLAAEAPPEDTGTSKPVIAILAFLIGGFTWGLGSILIKSGAAYGHEAALRRIRKKHEAEILERQGEVLEFEKKLNALTAQRVELKKLISVEQAAMAGARRRRRWR